MNLISKGNIYEMKKKPFVIGIMVYAINRIHQKNIYLFLLWVSARVQYSS